MTQENDIVLIHFEDKPLVFARVEAIWPDVKKNWYQIKLLLLQLPLQAVVWILRDAYIDGAEFTMNGKKMRLERIECPPDPDFEAETDAAPDTDKAGKDKEKAPAKKSSSPKVISLFGNKK
jgi:hypothetical protein